MSFYVGQKVVCVNSSGQVHNIGRVIRGRVYVVAGFDCGHTPNGHGLHLIGINNPPYNHGCGCVGPIAYKRARFRPLSELKEEARQRATANREEGVRL